MQIFLLIIHLLIVVSLVAVILLQQSASTGLGFGGDRDFMSVRGTKNALTRLTSILAAAFFIISLLQTIVSNINNSSRDVLRNIPNSTVSSKAAVPVGKPISITIPDSHKKPVDVGGKAAVKTPNSVSIPVTIPDSVLNKIKSDKGKVKDQHK